MANGRRGGGAEAARGIDDRKRDAVVCQRLQALLDVGGDVDRFDDRLGIGTPALPVGKRALRVGLDQADGVSGLDGRQRQADGKRAFSGTTLLGGQYDRLH